MLDYPTTAYFRHVRGRPDRSIIQDEWINRVISDPQHEAIQPDGRVRRWKRIPEAGGRALRVILLADQITIHNAFFDRAFREVSDEGHVF
jgi:O-methyltransferase involved in polyketide biosynthesis